MIDIHSLIPLEIEVIKLVGDGLTNAEIAEELSYSKRTIANTIHMLCRKFGLVRHKGRRMILARIDWELDRNGNI
jgi:DNA-binding CsgD family transcriptional regulator